jgi:hypothetical protein
VRGPSVSAWKIDVRLGVKGRHQKASGPRLMRRPAGFDTDKTWRQLLEERQDIATFQLSANNRLSAGVNAVTWKTDLEISNPLVVIVCIARSSGSWEP